MKVAKKIFTLLCDDIRQEEGGKTSLMGIYGQDVIVDKIPTILPKLCLSIFIEGIKEPFSDIKIILKSPESDDYPMKLAAPPDLKLNDSLQLIMALSPFRVKAAGEAKFGIYFGHAKRPSSTHKFEIKEMTKPKV